MSYGISATLKLIVDAEGQEGAVEARMAEEAAQAEAASQNIQPEAVESPGTDGADEQAPSTDPEAGVEGVEGEQQP